MIKLKINKLIISKLIICYETFNPYKIYLGMIFLFIIILVLSVFSGYYLNKLSDKTSAILKENYLSVVYAREMSEGMMNINQEINNKLLNEQEF